MDSGSVPVSAESVDSRFSRQTDIVDYAEMLDAVDYHWLRFYLHLAYAVFELRFR